MPGGELRALVRRSDELLMQRAGLAPCWPADATGTVLQARASEDEIAALEARLKVSLPPSYRAFLGIADGAWAKCGWGETGLPEEPKDGDEEVALRDARLSRHVARRMVPRSRARLRRHLDGRNVRYRRPEPGRGRAIPECEYLDHDREQDSIHAKAWHLLHALQVSGNIDGYTILLNPLVVDQHGEWEA